MKVINNINNLGEGLTKALPILLALTLSSTSFAQINEEISLIQVRSKDKGVGVRSYVQILHGRQLEKNLGSTDKNGDLTLQSPVNCISRIILVEPRSPKYLPYKEDISCDKPELVELETNDNTWVSVIPAKNWLTTHNLIANISSFADVVETSALLSFDYSEKIKAYDVESARVSRRIAIRDTASALGFSGFVFSDLNKNIISSDFSRALRAYQNINGLIPDGKINRRTLQKMAGHSTELFEASVLERQDLKHIKSGKFTADDSLWLEELASAGNTKVQGLVLEIQQKESIGLPSTQLINDYYQLAISDVANIHNSEETIVYRFYDLLEVAIKSKGQPGDYFVENFSVYDPTQSRIVLSKDGLKLVKSFQTNEGLTADGIIGPKTILAIMNPEN